MSGESARDAVGEKQAAEALRRGFVTSDQIEECRTILARMNEMGVVSLSLVDVLVDKGFLTVEQQAVIAVKDTARRRKVQIPGYRFLKKLGQGGMGAVYLAHQESMDRKVAIKVLPRKMVGQHGYVERFNREAQAAARLNHENIVGAIDCGEASGYYYFVMEYVPGKTARDLIGDGNSVPETQSLRIGLQIARALEHADTNRMVHRDVKPSNIIIDEHGVAKLCDMGLAKELNADATITQTGMAIGTPDYISPEQATGDKDLDIRADIYSLGATLYHLLTGRKPFTAATAMAVLTRHITDPLVPPRRHVPHLKSDTDRLIRRMMEKDPNRRYATPAEVVDDIEKILAGRPIATPSSQRSRTARRPTAPTGSQGNRGRQVAIGTAIGLTGLFLLSFIFGGEDPPTQPGVTTNNNPAPVKPKPVEPVPEEKPFTPEQMDGSQFTGEPEWLGLLETLRNNPDDWRGNAQRVQELLRHSTDGPYRARVLAVLEAHRDAKNAASRDHWEQMQQDARVMAAEAVGVFQVPRFLSSFPPELRFLQDPGSSGGPVPTEGFAACEEFRQLLEETLGLVQGVNESLQGIKQSGSWSTLDAPLGSCMRKLESLEPVFAAKLAERLASAHLKAAMDRGEFERLPGILAFYRNSPWADDLAPFLDRIETALDQQDLLPRSGTPEPLDHGDASDLLKNALEFLATGQPARALATVNRVLSTDVDHVDARVIRARIFLALRQYRSCLEDLAVAVRSEPERAELYLLSAQAKLHLGMEGATGDLQRALALDPENVEAHLYLADLYRWARDLEAALNSVEQAEALTDDPALLATAQRIRAKCHLAQGDHKEAINAAKSAIDLDPDHPDSHVVVGLIELDRSRERDARNAFDRALELDSDCSDAHRGRGDLARSEGKLDVAEKAYRRAIDADPSNARAWYGRACTRPDSEYSEALDELGKAIAIEPWESDYRLERVRRQIDRGEYTEAMEDLTAVLTLDPANPEALLQRATVYITAATAGGERDQSVQFLRLAVTDLDRVLDKDDRNETAYQHRAVARYHLEEYEGAIEDAGKALRQDGRNIDVLIVRAGSSMALSRTRDAISDYERILRIERNHPEALYGRALAQLYQERYSQARKDLERIEDTSPQWYEENEDRVTPLLEAIEDALED